MKIEDFIKSSVKNCPPSGIRKYFDLLNEMPDAISLGVGEPDFQTPWNIREAGIYSLEKGQTKYSANAGYIELRKEISKYAFEKYNLNYNFQDEILVTVGGSEAIDLALRTLTGPGDEVIIPEPSFVAYKGCTYFTGATPVLLNLCEEDNFKLTAAKLEAVLTDKTRVVIIAFPSNPTGAVMTREDLLPIVNVLKDKDIIIISDEIYAELTYNGRHVSIAEFPEVSEKTVVVNGFSKAYSMTGWRLGYAMGNKHIIEAMKKIHQYAIMCAPSTAQRAAIEALLHGEDSVALMRSEYDQRRRLMLDAFEEMGLSCFEPEGAFYLFPSIKSTGFSSDEFAERLLKEQRVLVIPGTAFGECGEGFIRVCYAESTERLKEALKRMGVFLRDLKGKA